MNQTSIYTLVLTLQTEHSVRIRRSTYPSEHSLEHVDLVINDSTLGFSGSNSANICSIERVFPQHYSQH